MISTVAQLRDKLIEDGLASVRAYETRPERLRAGEAGFELCRMLETPEDFGRVLDQRHRMETHLRDEDVATEVYWEYHFATAQVEFVFEHLKVAWDVGPTYNARAVLHIANLCGGSGLPGAKG